MSETLRSVTVDRTGPARYTATNSKGATIEFGNDSEIGFTPVELLLAAIGGATAIDADVATTRHTEPLRFQVTVRGDKIADDEGNRMENLAVTFDVEFPE